MVMIKLVTLLVSILFLLTTFCKAQVGIGTSNPNLSAQLDVSSSSKGFLPPRMTASQRSGIASPAAGLMIWCSNCGTSMGELQIFDGVSWKNSAGGAVAPPFTCGSSAVAFNYRNGSVSYGTVVGANNKCWLDRNLGATRVAQSSTDFSAYGDLFQWGRGDDGHQSITWTSATQTGSAGATTTTLSSTASPGNGNFIISSAFPYDWLSPQNPNLWQGVSGANNVCPTGWRLPTEAEWEAESASWNTSNIAGAFGSSLRLTLAGMRHYQTGTLSNVGSYSYYWASSITGSFPSCLLIGSGAAGLSTDAAAAGFPVRCIKN